MASSEGQFSNTFNFGSKAVPADSAYLARQANTRYAGEAHSYVDQRAAHDVRDRWANDRDLRDGRGMWESRDEVEAEAWRAARRRAEWPARHHLPYQRRARPQTFTRPTVPFAHDRNTLRPSPPPPSPPPPDPAMGATKRTSTGEAKPVGPHPGTVRVSAPYCSQASVDKKNQTSSLDIHERSIAEAREDNARLQGVAWLDNVRRALQLPIRTYTTSCVYYHKFRLAHPSVPGGLEYDWMHAAAASLLTACKVEDTLKKSKDILAAAWNLRNPQHEPLGNDDATFEQPSRLVIGLERLVLEASGFDFRSSQSHPIVVKLCRELPATQLRERVGRIAWTVLTDLHRTYAPLKQTSATLAIASLDLAARLQDVATNNEESAALVAAMTEFDLKKWNLGREEVMETLLDAVELYTQHTNSTILGTRYTLDDYLRVRLGLNKECAEANLPRHTTASSPASVLRTEVSVANGHPTPVSPTEQIGQQQAPHNGPTQLPMPPMPEGGGTLRFTLNPEMALQEKSEVQKYFVEEWEEYDEEIDVPVPRAGSDGRDRDLDRDLDRLGHPSRVREWDERSRSSYDSPKPRDLTAHAGRHDEREDRFSDRERDRGRERSPLLRSNRVPRDREGYGRPPPREGPSTRERDLIRDRPSHRDRERNDRERRYEERRYDERRYDDRGRGRYDERDRRYGSSRYDDRGRR